MAAASSCCTFYPSAAATAAKPGRAFPPAAAPPRPNPSLLLRPKRSIPKVAARSSNGSSSTPPQPNPGDNESRIVLDAFFLGKAFAEALTEKIESTVGEIFSVVGQWQAEQQKQVQDFEEEVIERAKRAKERAAMEVVDEKSPRSLEAHSTTVTAPTSPASPTKAEQQLSGGTE